MVGWPLGFEGPPKHALCAGPKPMRGLNFQIGSFFEDRLFNHPMSLGKKTLLSMIPFYKGDRCQTYSCLTFWQRRPTLGLACRVAVGERLAGFEGPGEYHRYSGPWK